MLIWLTKQLLTLRKALAGTIEPRQLAWAVALGVLIGLVPKGNLLAVSLIAGIFILNINHAMFAVTTVACTFIGGFLDPLSHRLGTFLLGHVEIQPWLSQLYALPLVPWTDLNNTVVLGSFLIGLAAVPPTYGVTLPIFKALARRRNQAVPEFETGYRHDGERAEVPALTVVPASIEDDNLIPAASYATQIDVIRFKSPPNQLADPDSVTSQPTAQDLSTSEVNEALRYLVRLAREKREGKAA